VLHRRRIDGLTYRGQERLPFCAISAEDADLDQFMCYETAIDFRNNRGAQAAVTDRRYWMERVGARAQGAPLRGSQSEHG
jgi:hypothetical protein